MADFIQAVKWMEEGKKVKNSDMGKDVYLFEENGKIYHRGLQDSKDDRVRMVPHTYFFKSDWEIVGEKDDWKLSDQFELASDFGMSCPVIDVEDVKKFIEKVKEDIMTLGADEFTRVRRKGACRIIDERAGDL